MTNSNDPKDTGGDQSDDLIAELARIVADDAKRDTVSDAIHERTQVAAAARSDLSNRYSLDSAPETASPDTVGKEIETPPARQTTSVEEFLGKQPVHEQSDPAQELSSIIAAGQSAPAKPTVPASGLDHLLGIKAEDAKSSYEFDFADSIKSGVTSDIPVHEEISFHSELAPEPPLAASKEPDGIAAIIEDLEQQSERQSESPVDQLETASIGSAQSSTDAFVVAPSTQGIGASTDDGSEDALAEIESLIADTAAPTDSDNQRQVNPNPAEAAILTAMASSAKTNDHEPSHVPQEEISPEVAEIPVSETPELSVDEPDLDIGQSMHAEHSFAGKTADRNGFPIWPVLLLLLLLVGVGGAGYWFYFGQPINADVPIVSAQNTEVKADPEVVKPPTENSSVFEALEGNSENPADEQIVPREETPVETPNTVTRVITPTSTSNGLTNRKVKTVTVLSDGTIVSGDESSAGAEQLPSDVRPDVPQVSLEDTATATTDEIANVLNSIVQDTTAIVEDATVAATNDTASNEASTEVSTPVVEPVVPTVETTPTTTQETTPVVEVQETVPVDDPSAPVPPVRPEGLVLTTQSNSATLNPTASQPISLLPDITPVTTPTLVVAPVLTSITPTTSDVDAPFYVQLSSRRSPVDAQSTAQILQRQFADVLANETVDIHQVNLGEKGIFYRVRVPKNSLADANLLCGNIKASGGDCFVRNN